MNEPAVIAKIPVVDPATIRTDAGVVMLPVVVIATTDPAAGAGPFNVTVHVDAPPGLRDEGKHEIELRVTVTVILPDAAFIPTAIPSGVVPRVPLKATVTFDDPENVAESVAIVPLPIAFRFVP